MKSDPLGQEKDSIAYSGLWNEETSGARSSDSVGDYAEFTFTGTSMKWIGPKRPDGGMAHIYIDGTRLDYPVDTYHRQAKERQVLYTTNSLTNKRHTVRVQISTATHPESGGRFVAVDSFEFGTASPPPVPLPSQALPQQAPRWELTTDDTEVGLTVWENRLYMEKLANPKRGWNWAAAPIEIPLLSQATCEGTAELLHWTYREGKESRTAEGCKVTLIFASCSPELELHATWEARPGGGPVEQTTTLYNLTGRPISCDYADVVAANANVRADKQATLWIFNRNKFLIYDAEGGIGVQKTTLGMEAHIESLADTDGWSRNSQMPYQIFDVNSEHGLYFGYMWAFGRFVDRTSGDPLAINYAAYLGDEGTVAIGSGKSFAVPGMIYGAYSGDADDGSNSMKRWFWDYKMTPTLRENPDEPPITFVLMGSEEEANTLFASYPMASWGGEMGKFDIEWLQHPSTGLYDVNDWLPDAKKWPNGFTGGTICHENGVKCGLYLSNTYLNCDISTQEGRELEKAALLDRFDNYHYEYWKSDFHVEGPEYSHVNNYRAHEGLLEIVDYMIAARPSFRYYHCWGAAVLKEFTMLQRATFMTVEDSASPDSIRLAYYANCYMINPVQLLIELAIPGTSCTAAFGSIDDPAWVDYCLRTGFMGANFATGLGSYTPTMEERTKLHWPLYRTRMRPILRRADVYHILPQPDGTDWDGMQYMNARLNRGAALLFKSAAHLPAERRILLKGLDREAIYSLAFQDREHLNASMSGAELMDSGVNVTGMAGAHASEIVWIDKRA